MRLVLAALVVTAASLGGAAYVNRASADDTTVVSQSGGRVAGLDLNALTGNADTNRRMLALAYDQVEREYYKPVDAQALLRGEHKALIAFLKARKVAKPSLPDAMASGDRQRDLALLQTEVQVAQRAYPRAGTHDEFTQAAISGMLSSLGDPYTAYLSKAEINGLEEQLRGGNFGGIGVYIVQDPKTGAIIVDPIEGNPAIKAGVRPGDVITAVDDTSTMGEKLDAVEKRIRGPLGTVVSLKIRRHDATERTVRVTRAEIHVPSVRAKMEDGVDYVRLADFGQTSADEVRAAMLDGKRHNARGYILDLRNNGGGLLDAAVDISSLFIAQGTIVSTVDRAGNKKSKSASGGAIGVTPLVLLVNKYTASASEITAGAVQDYHAGTIVGTKTFGKGVVQSLYNLPDKGALKITTARYLTPAGRDIHHKGILPDVTVDQRVDVPIDTANDKQLAVAKSILKKDSK
ncbi:MAG: S41 family peptidase [Candidatus Velthaea sp.]